MSREFSVPARVVTVTVGCKPRPAHRASTGTVDTHSALIALSTSCRKRSSGQEASGPEAHCGIVTNARSGPSAWLGLGLG